MTIKATGNHSPSRLASRTGTTITTDKMLIITEGESSEWFKVHDGATAIVNNGIINGEGESCNTDLLVFGAKSNLKRNNIAITLDGAHGEGVVAERGAKVKIEDITINSTEEDFVGLLTQNQSQLKGKNITINAKAKNSRGVTALTNREVVIEEIKIISKKENFYGM